MQASTLIVVALLVIPLVDALAPPSRVAVLTSVPLEIPIVGSLSGTSMARPHVSGIAALVKAHFPALDGAGIRARDWTRPPWTSAPSGATTRAGTGASTGWPRLRRKRRLRRHAPRAQ